jgi:thiol-disulfide isomerase/thioredoxin
MALRFLLGVFITILTAHAVAAQVADPQLLTVEGLLVCSVCCFEADRNTTPYGDAADLKCAADCADKNIPPALAVKDGDNYKLFIVEAGKLKKTPQEWLDSMSKQLRITGRVRRQQDKWYIAADSVSVISSSAISRAQAAIVGTEAELSLKDLFGVDQKLSSYRGRIVVLNFWATWCVPCRAELPDLVALQNEYAALGVQVIGASADELTDRNDVLKFIKETRINFPVWVGLSTAEMKRFGVGPSLPATLIINREGKIDTVYPSVIKRVDLETRIESMLKTDAAAVERQTRDVSETRDVSLVPS